MEEAMTGWIKGTCEANGIDVHYIRTGGNKPPVVLLHGLMTNGACWTPLARTLEKHYSFWMQQYFNLRPWPIPYSKSPGDAFEKSRINMANWIKCGLSSADYKTAF